MTNPRRATTVALAALAVATTLATQGCDAGPAAKAATTAAHPDLSYAQARTVYQSYVTNSDNAAAQGNVAAGLSILADAPLVIARAQLATGSAPVKRYVYGTPTFYVPVLNSYPRWFVADVSRRARGSSPMGSGRVLMVFGESKPADAWVLDEETALAPGQTMPAIATDANGYATALPTYQRGLLLQPNVMGGTQAAVVDEGKENPAASLIAPGPETTDLYNEQSALSAGTAKDLTYAWYLTGAVFPLFSMRTTSGGALVFYGMTLNTELTHAIAGTETPIPVPADLRALFTKPDEKSIHSVDGYWTYEFAAVDPPASASDGKAAVIAATSALTAAHSS